MTKASATANAHLTESTAEDEFDARLRFLLETAAAVFLAVGYEAASVGEIAKARKGLKTNDLFTLPQQGRTISGCGYDARRHQFPPALRLTCLPGPAAKGSHALWRTDCLK